MESTAVLASGPSSSYVHYTETSERLTKVESNDQREEDNEASVSFRHSGTAHMRNRVIRALKEVEGSFRVVERVQKCGQFARVQKSTEDNPRFRVRCDRCHHRFCPACGMEKSRLMAHAVLKKVEDETIRFLTLTLKHREEVLGTTIDRILRSFKELRRWSLWKKNVNGGIGFLEVKRTNGWHVHLHILITGRYLPYQELRAKWLEITKDSFVIDIRLVQRKEEIIGYVCKYVSKPLDRSILHDHASLKEAITHLHGRRLVITFGDWKGWRVTDPHCTTEWIDVDSLASILRRARRGDPRAGRILRNLTDADPSSYLAVVTDSS